MIIKEHKTIFVHIPKNAGTAIEEYFGNSSFRIQPSKHDDIHEIKKRFLNIYSSHRKFTIIRNPYDRMISWYFYLKRAMGIEQTRGDHRWSSGEHFPSNFLEWIKDPLKNYYTLWKLSDIRNSLHTDIEFIGNGRKNGVPLLSQQYLWLDDTVRVLKYENLNEELNKFFGKKINIPTRNNTERKDYLHYYDEESLNIVYNRYKEDFEIFNYKRIEKI